MEANRIDSFGKYSEERKIVGPVVTTQNLHEVQADEYPDCENAGDGKWCFKRSRLEVRVPDSNWRFSGSAAIEVVKDNQGAAAWNVLGAPDRTFIIQNDPDHIIWEILTSSHSIEVNLSCLARHYP